MTNPNFENGNKPLLSELKRQPPPHGLKGLRAKLEQAEAGRWANAGLSLVQLIRGPLLAPALSALSLMTLVWLLRAPIYAWFDPYAATNPEFAQALQQQLEMARNPTPLVMAGEGDEAVFFEVETADPDIRFYWVLQ